MADVRVRNADNFVLEAALDGTLVALAGQTIFTEPATFIPSWNDVTWERTGVSTYVINNALTGPLNDADSPENQGTVVSVTGADTAPDTLDNSIIAGTGITTTVLNPGADETLSLSVDPAAIDHDALLNFVADEHVAHSGVSVTAGGDDGILAANDDLSANIGLSVDITGTTALAATPDAADEFLMWDASGTALRKVTLTEILNSVSANDTQTWNGGIRNVKPNQSQNAVWGNQDATAGPTMAFAGNIVGFSVTSNSPLTAGTVTFSVSINGVAQNAAGQPLVVTSPAVNGFNDLTSAPIVVVAGDVIDIGVISGAGIAPNNTDWTVTFWYSV